MARYLLRVLVTLVVIGSTVAVASPAHASDPPPNCSFLYLSTGFGPITQCAVVNGGVGVAAYYSPVTGHYSPTTGPLTVEVHAPYVLFVPGADGQYGTFSGHTSFITAFGPTIYGAQYQDLARGRFGNLNLITGLFYPSSGWLPVAKER